MKKLTIKLLAALALLVSTAPDMLANEFPNRPIRLVVPFTPAGGTDVLARSVAEGLTSQLGQRVIVENRPGAGGNIGAEAVARAAADGYTLLFGTSGPLVINVSLFQRLSYDPLESFDPIGMVGYLPNVLVVAPNLPVRSIDELIGYARANPGRLSFASSGNGSSTHLSGMLFNNLTQVALSHVPYAGNGPAINDVIGGHIPMAFVDVLTARPFIDERRMRALGVTSATRSAVLPSVPTIAEQGLPGFETSVFFAMVTPRGTPADIVAKLNQALASVAASPQFQTFLATQGIIASPDTSPTYLANFMRQEIPRWRELVRSSQARVD